jgi:hypothetical protein
MNMPNVPNDYIDAELQGLVGSSSTTEVTRSLCPAPEFIIDQDPLAEFPFETEDLPTELPFEKVRTDIDIRKKTSTVISEKLSLEKLPPANSSRNEPYIKGMIDATRHRSVFKTIKHSEVWATLVQSCTDFVDAQVAEAAR